MAMTDEQIERYSRHIILKEVGAKGQKKLLKGKVLIIGAGGLGAPAAMYLAAAGVGTIGIVDADEVDLSNLQRQIIHSTADIGKAKVKSAKETMNAMNPDIEVKTYRMFVDASNIRELIREIAVDRTVLLSTHILSEVQATCDYIRMIEEGQVVFSGTVDEFDNYIVPNTLFVSLIAAPLAEVIREIPGVVAVEELGGSKFRIQFSDALEATERLVEASVTKGWRLVEIRQEKSSLDEIFAELSKK